VIANKLQTKTMTGNNNDIKFVPQAAKTYEVRYVEVEIKEPSKLTQIANYLGIKTAECTPSNNGSSSNGGGSGGSGSGGSEGNNGSGSNGGGKIVDKTVENYQAAVRHAQNQASQASAEAAQEICEIL